MELLFQAHVVVWRWRELTGHNGLSCYRKRLMIRLQLTTSALEVVVSTNRNNFSGIHYVWGKRYQPHHRPQ